MTDRETTLAHLRDQEASLRGHLAYLEADDFAYSNGFGRAISHTRTQLSEVRRRIADIEMMQPIN